MPFDNPATASPRRLPLQFVDIKITPLLGGQFSVSMQATLLDEDHLDFVGEELADEHVDTIDQALAVIRKNAGALAAVCAR